MSYRLLHLLLAVLISFSCCTAAPDLTLVSNKTSAYSIVLPAEPSKTEQHAADVLQQYIQKVTGAQLAIVKEGSGKIATAIYVGNTRRAATLINGKMTGESYRLQTANKDLMICGGSGKGVVYGVYTFIEEYLHCRKPAPDATIIPAIATLTIPGDLKEEHAPQFIYREVYYPYSYDREYQEWNKLQQFEDLWGLWGHSYNKLVPAQTYFKSHPEYYALVKGVRQPTQLCLSNEAVYNIAVAELRKRMAANPDGMYWSVSPNDDNGYCECDKCKAVDNEEGSPSGSLIKFVNRVAGTFPNNYFTTLAYGYTHRAPKNLKPAKNVYIMLSDIDAFRDKPLAQESTAAPFRNDLKAWGAITPNIFIWDYITQFTAYVAPFPNFHTLQPNMQYFKEHGVKGVFAQGSGDTYGEWAELRSYVTAKLLDNDTANVAQLTSTFMNDYYGKAAKYLQQYADQLQAGMLASKRKLDIYGNPINEWDSYLTPASLDLYSELFDKAAAATEGNEKIYERVTRAGLPLEYTVLQQARFYGIDKHGIFEQDDNGAWVVKPKFAEKVAHFVAACKKAKVTELSEGGPNPDAYQAEWNAIFAAGVTPTKALGAAVSFKYPFVEDYPAKGNKTLVDGTPGYTDFSYNWLGFYGVPMVATIDMGKAQPVSAIKMHFLDDPRHWIFLPVQITIEVSEDGMNYNSVASITPVADEEHYAAAVKEFAAPYKGKARYIRVTANNMSTLPLWRLRDNKKPMIACDEIFVQ